MQDRGKNYEKHYLSIHSWYNAGTMNIAGTMNFKEHELIKINNSPPDSKLGSKLPI